MDEHRQCAVCGHEQWYHDFRGGKCGFQNEARVFCPCLKFVEPQLNGQNNGRRRVLFAACAAGRR